MAKTDLIILQKLESLLDGSFTKTYDVDIKEWMHRKALQYELAGVVFNQLSL